jgi:hypothetical protein
MSPYRQPASKPRRDGKPRRAKLRIGWPIWPLPLDQEVEAFVALVFLLAALLAWVPRYL